MATTSTGPRVWVGCLACYNAGRLIGAWVDAAEGPDYVPDGHVVRCLSCGELGAHPETLCPARFDRGDGRREHYVGITGPDDSPHEEQWCMDHEGFDGLLEGECSPAEAARLAEILDGIESDGYPVEAVAGYFAHVGERLEEWDAPTAETFADAWCGEFDSGADYAEELASDVVEDFEERTSAWPFSCIDWERAWHELEYGGDNFTIDAGGGRVYVFRST